MINNEAFLNCPNLTSVTFGGKIAEYYLQEKAFPGNLREMYLENGPGTYTRASGSNEWQKEAQGA
jgi:hypothetical protein